MTDEQPAVIVQEAWNEYYRRAKRHFSASAKRLYGKKWKQSFEMSYTEDDALSAIETDMKISFGRLTEEILRKYNVFIDHEDDVITATKYVRLAPHMLLRLQTSSGAEVDAEIIDD
jgi:hypothetical protein